MKLSGEVGNLKARLGVLDKGSHQDTLVAIEAERNKLMTDNEEFD